ncbi:ANTAR domain-containing protein [Streptomyces sp. NPDC057910]|uniref:ANTAR domain-containing protein n=1 Tax=Streptomyces sp. NPDC057910 TaxID=3346278 RepID=UPI0036ECB16D
MAERTEPEGRVEALEEELAQMRRAVVSHAVIDQAIGVVLAYGRVPARRGWQVLTEVSQNTNVKLRVVAEHLVRWPHRAWLPPEIHRALNAALEHDRPSPGEAAGPRERIAPVSPK